MLTKSEGLVHELGADHPAVRNLVAAISDLCQVYLRLLAQVNQGQPESTSNSLTLAPDTPLLLKVPQAAKLLSISTSQMYALIAEKKIPIVRMGERATRISRLTLENLIREMEQPKGKHRRG